MKLKSVNQFELLAFEAAVCEHLACDTSALALVDYLQEHGAKPMTAKRRVRELRREECHRRHYVEVRRMIDFEHGFESRVLRAVNFAIDGWMALDYTMVVENGVRSPYWFSGWDWVMGPTGIRTILGEDAGMSSGVINPDDEDRLVIVGATWLNRSMELHLLDFG